MGRTFKSLLADKRGNFAILTALGLPLLFGAVGAGMETTRVMQVKNDMQTVLDSATLAVATHARIDEGKKSDAEYAAEVRQRLENYGVDDDDDASASGNGKGNGNGNGNG
ncbi:TadE/TadG family type IV pilus assembly protein, partial [Agrobacterium cavarae]